MLLPILVLWSSLAPLLSARQIISVRLELSAGWFCVPAGVLAALGFLYFTKGASKRMLAFSWTLSIVAILALIATQRASDRMFVHWKIAYVPERNWPMLASELSGLARELALRSGDGVSIIPTDRLPSDFSYLGRCNEYFGGFAETDVTGVGTITSRVAYGYQGRRWGLFLGLEEFLVARWPNYAFQKVTNGCYLFAGPD